LIIRNGTGVIIDTPAVNAANMRRSFSDIKGESVCFAGGYSDALRIMRITHAERLWEETVPLDGGGENSIRIIYGYSRLLGKCVETDGKRINLQIAVNSQGGKVTAGTPLILGSY